MLTSPAFRPTHLKLSLLPYTFSLRKGSGLASRPFLSLDNPFGITGGHLAPDTTAVRNKTPFTSGTTGPPDTKRPPDTGTFYPRRRRHTYSLRPLLVTLK